MILNESGHLEPADMCSQAGLNPRLDMLADAGSMFKTVLILANAICMSGPPPGAGHSGDSLAAVCNQCSMSARSNSGSGSKSELSLSAASI